MKFISTRGKVAPVSLSQALRDGAAGDGGLYWPDRLPPRPDRLDAGLPLAAFAAQLLAPFFDGDPLAGALAAMTAEAFDFPLPLVHPHPARPGLGAAELFHGPTAAFKDFGARFLMAGFDRLADGAPLTVLAATSGDTGGAVGCAADGRGAVRAAILYPAGRVSPFQQRQLCCWGDNVVALEVAGDFDDCQRLVKAAFANRALVDRHRLTSANSINIGRLLPQMAYAGWIAARIEADGGIAPGFIVPTGNLGHGLALLMARAMGLPVGPVVLATNANATLDEWQRLGHYRPRASVATIANAMDVGDPSNFERLIALPPAQRALRVERVEDAAIRARIRTDFAASGYIWCPHSATAAEAYHRLSPADQQARPWVVMATAHPAKFAEIVEPLIGTAVPRPPALDAIDGRPQRQQPIAATTDALTEALAAAAG